MHLQSRAYSLFNDDLILPIGTSTNDVRDKEEDENIECVSNNDRILPE